MKYEPVATTVVICDSNNGDLIFIYSPFFSLLWQKYISCEGLLNKDKSFFCPATPLESHIRHIYIVLHNFHTYVQSRFIIISNYKKEVGRGII